jgi:hypothetical protein
MLQTPINVHFASHPVCCKVPLLSLGAQFLKEAVLDFGSSTLLLIIVLKQSKNTFTQDCDGTYTRQQFWDRQHPDSSTHRLIPDNNPQT